MVDFLDRDVFQPYPELLVFLTVALGFLVGRIRYKAITLGSVTGCLIVGPFLGAQFHVGVDQTVKSLFFIMFLFALGYRVGPQFFRGLRKDGLPQVLNGPGGVPGGARRHVPVRQAPRLRPRPRRRAARRGPHPVGGDRGRAGRDRQPPGPERRPDQGGVEPGPDRVRGHLSARHDPVRHPPRQHPAPPLPRGPGRRIGPAGQGDGRAERRPRPRRGLLRDRAARLPPGASRPGGPDDRRLRGAAGAPRAPRLHHAGAQGGEDPAARPVAHARARRHGRGERAARLARGPRRAHAHRAGGGRRGSAHLRHGVAARGGLREGAARPDDRGAAPGALHGGGVRGRGLPLGGALPVPALDEAEPGRHAGPQGSEAARGAGGAGGRQAGADELRDGHGVGGARHLRRRLPRHPGGDAGRGADLAVDLRGRAHHGPGLRLDQGPLPDLRNVPPGAQWFMDTLGLCLFVAVVGINAGPSFTSGLAKAGWGLLLFGAIATLVPLVIGFLFGHYVQHIRFPILMGVLAGGQTTTAAIGAIGEAAKSQVPTLGYTIPYAFGNVLLTIWGAVIVLLNH